MAVLLNLLFNHLKGSGSKGQSALFAAPPRMVREEELAALEDGDQYEGGKLISRDGTDVTIVPTGSIQTISPKDGKASPSSTNDH